MNFEIEISSVATRVEVCVTFVYLMSHDIKTHHQFVKITKKASFGKTFMNLKAICHGTKSAFLSKVA